MRSAQRTYRKTMFIAFASYALLLPLSIEGHEPPDRQVSSLEQ